MPRWPESKPIQVVCANPLCGKVFVWRRGLAHLNRSKGRHCCSRRCQNTRHGLGGTPRHKLWEGAKKRCGETGLIFALTVHDVPAVPRRCPVLGILLVSNTKAGPIDSSPSLDRINPALGYVPGNVRVISYRANRLRSDATAAELRKVARDAVRLERSR